MNKFLLCNILLIGMWSPLSWADGTTTDPSVVAPTDPSAVASTDPNAPDDELAVFTVRPPYHIHRMAISNTPVGLFPDKIRSIYGLNHAGSNLGAGVTIAIVDAYDGRTVEQDFAIFNSTFGLPECSTANGCFTIIPSGARHIRFNSGWGLEEALDVQWAHVVAPNAKILLVEAKSNSLRDIGNAINDAVAAGANIISMSLGGSEAASELGFDAQYLVIHPNVIFVAAAGDAGLPASYPSASPFVISVGGTTLNFDQSGNFLTETGWSGGGGGVSAYEQQPAFQSASICSAVNCAANSTNTPMRATPDVAYNGNPVSGVAVYDSSYPNAGPWIQVGGTSAGSPQVAALLAVAMSDGASFNGSDPTNPSSVLQMLYSTYPGGSLGISNGNVSYSLGFFDVTQGNNGAPAKPGFDLTSGLGSPRE